MIQMFGEGRDRCMGNELSCQCPSFVQRKFETEELTVLNREDEARLHLFYQSENTLNRNRRFIYSLIKQV